MTEGLVNFSQRNQVLLNRKENVSNLYASAKENIAKYTFKPQLSEYSRVLAGDSRRTPVDLAYKPIIQKERHISELREKQKQKEEAEFRSLHNFRNKKRGREDGRERYAHVGSKLHLQSSHSEYIQGYKDKQADREESRLLEEKRRKIHELGECSHHPLINIGGHIREDSNYVRGIDAPNASYTNIYWKREGSTYDDRSIDTPQRSPQRDHLEGNSHCIYDLHFVKRGVKPRHLQ